MKSMMILLLSWFVLACGADADTSTVNRDTLTQRQKDSIIANSKIPGAGAVRRAMSVVDAVNARTARADSLAQDTAQE
ncbi:MAG: hypothetical protein ACREME_04895 [Gemmatimonadales bacterium]